MRGAGRALQRPVERLDPVPPGHLGPGLQPRLVQLDDVGPGGEQVGDLGPDDVGVGQRQLAVVAVVVVLRLLGHRERTRDGDLHGPVGVRAQEADVVGLHRPRPGDRPDDAGDRDVQAGAVAHRARVVQVDALQRRGEVVGVGLPPDLAVPDDVQTGLLLARMVTSVASSCASASRSAGMRQSSAARTRGGNWWPSRSRSISQSGWGRLPTTVVGSVGSGRGMPRILPHAGVTGARSWVRVAHPPGSTRSCP